MLTQDFIRLRRIPSWANNFCSLREHVRWQDAQKYQNVLAMYRKVRDHSAYDFRFVLGRYALYGRNGVPKDRGIAEYWLREAIRSGSTRAQQLLDQIEGHAHAE